MPAVTPEDVLALPRIVAPREGVTERVVLAVVDAPTMLEGEGFKVRRAFAGHEGPGSTRTPITYAHASIGPGARLRLPWRTDFNALVYVLAGHGTVGAERRPVVEGELAIFGDGDVFELRADTGQDANAPPLEVLLLGGRPIREEIAWYGPFVMNTKAEIIEAIDDYQAGRMGSIPAESAAPIPAESTAGSSAADGAAGSEAEPQSSAE